MMNPDSEELVKRPVAFRVRQHRLSNYYELYTDEKDAQFWADARGVDYEGLYLVADRHTAPPAGAGMREAVEEARERLLNIWAGRCPGVGCEGDPVAFRDWATAYADAGVKSLDKALTALGATTKSDVEALAATAAGRPGTVTSEPEPSPSDPSSTRSEVTALADIAKERLRQHNVEGWTPEHDDAHVSAELAMAGACYALASFLNTEHALNTTFTRYWPWDRKWWKPKTPRENLVRAGALIVAEIERLDRLDQFEIRRK